MLTGVLQVALGDDQVITMLHVDMHTHTHNIPQFKKHVRKALDVKTPEVYLTLLAPRHPPEQHGDHKISAEGPGPVGGD